MPKIGIENLQDNIVNILNSPGELTQLETTDKNNIVGTINEIYDIRITEDIQRKQKLVDTLISKGVEASINNSWVAYE